MVGGSGIAKRVKDRRAVGVCRCEALTGSTGENADQCSEGSRALFQGGGSLAPQWSNREVRSSLVVQHKLDPCAATGVVWSRRLGPEESV